MLRRLMLAEDAVLEKIQYPVIMQPKIDGVRACNQEGVLLPRSLKTFPNEFTMEYYSDWALDGFDGEMSADSNCHPRLCTITSSALSTIAGKPFLEWWLFDDMSVASWPYEDRYSHLLDRVIKLREIGKWANHLQVMPMANVETPERLAKLHQMWCDAGFEGSIVRSPKLPYKFGRSTVNEGGLLRIKDFVEEEAIVVRVVEGELNTNEATIDERGYTARSSHKAGMVPNGMVGSLECRLLKPIKYLGKILLEAGQEITVAPGNMTHDQRRKMRYWENKRIKFKFFPKGLKDKLRFATFVSERMKEDT